MSIAGKNSRRHHRPGVVLLMALLFMAAITASTIVVSTIIYSTWRQSKNISSFIIASLGADSGLERDLAIVKQGREIQPIGVTTTATNVPAMSFPGSRVQVHVTGQNSDPLHLGAATVIPILQSNQSVTYDLVPYLNGCRSGDRPAGPDTIRVSAPNNVGTGILEISWVLLSQDATSVSTGKHYYDLAAYHLGKDALDISLTQVVPQSYTGGQPPAPYTGIVLGYRLRVTAIGGSVNNITLQPRRTGCIPPETSIESRIQITSTGSLAGAQSIKSASVLWQRPASSLFNYVFFTERDFTP